jgi:hypothetical protein
LHKKLNPPRGKTKDEQFPVYLDGDHTGRRAKSEDNTPTKPVHCGKNKKKEKEGRGDGLG